jgi:hypothetical protein
MRAGSLVHQALPMVQEAAQGALRRSPMLWGAADHDRSSGWPSLRA